MVLPKEPLLFLRILVLGVIYLSALHFGRARAILHLLARFPFGALSSCNARTARRVSPYVSVVLSLFPPWIQRRPCLLRSLLLFSFLRHVQHPLTLVVGVRRDARGIRGHSWVESSGEARSDVGDTGGFTPVWTHSA